MRVHGVCVALPDPADDGAWAGVLLRGPSGVGKSDLALRLIDEGARLVADDQVEIRMEGGVAIASSPAVIAGLLEARGLGLLRFDALPAAPIRLVADAVAADDAPRLPERQDAIIAEVATPRVGLAFAAPSASARVRLALRAVRLGLFAAPTSGLGSEGGPRFDDA